jgi:hypothetical protein
MVGKTGQLRMAAEANVAWHTRHQNLKVRIEIFFTPIYNSRCRLTKSHRWLETRGV